MTWPDNSASTGAAMSPRPRSSGNCSAVFEGWKDEALEEQPIHALLDAGSRLGHGADLGLFKSIDAHVRGWEPARRAAVLEKMTRAEFDAVEKEIDRIGLTPEKPFPFEWPLRDIKKYPPAAQGAFIAKIARRDRGEYAWAGVQGLKLAHPKLNLYGPNIGLIIQHLKGMSPADQVAFSSGSALHHADLIPADQRKEKLGQLWEVVSGLNDRDLEKKTLEGWARSSHSSRDSESAEIMSIVIDHAQAWPREQRLSLLSTCADFCHEEEPMEVDTHTPSAPAPKRDTMGLVKFHTAVEHAGEPGLDGASRASQVGELAQVVSRMAPGSDREKRMGNVAGLARDHLEPGAAEALVSMMATTFPEAPAQTGLSFGFGFRLAGG